MRMYELASRVDNSNSLILFPLGVIAVPAEDVTTCSHIRDFLLIECAKFGVSRDDADHCPVLVFPLLSAEWTTNKPDDDYIDAYVQKIDQLFELLNFAKIAPLDARPANIMWRKTDSSVDIQLVDFEDVLQFDDIVSPDFITFIVDNEDKRYPFSVRDRGQHVVAGLKHNLFFHSAVTQWARSDIVDFTQFMTLNYTAIVSSSQL